MTADAVDSLRWAVAWVCVTFTRGVSSEEVFTRYGADPDQARLLDWDAALDLAPGDEEASLLRAGSLGEWTFCVEEDGGIGALDGPLAKLSRGTETYSMATTDGMNVFQYWRDGECVENFEPGMEYTRPEPTTAWWDRVEAALAAHEGEDAGMAPVMALILDHLGITLDDATLARPWPSLTLAEDEVPSAPHGDTYAGEGPVPRGTAPTAARTGPGRESPRSAGR
ncbi:hypothetical protein KUF83_35520 [Streptomyces sp. BV286]|uniref:DUF6461 domain-containing protein n=1 Tax=Streptomyces sp. BV286 TaxID=2849672 RepID=UPI001C2E1A4C|nr:DUF6461 domain-containing protein [Streptomyces sp. BV286]MBV1941830.1 hypothetical protein [Streptomyces sp. BV286]